MNKRQLIKEANQYRKQPEVPAGGIIIFSPLGVLSGWRDKLRNPETQAPGCLAIDEDGTIHKAQGGDWQNGALEWVLV